MLTYLAQSGPLLSFQNKEFPANGFEKAIQHFTKPGDKVWNNILDGYMYTQNDRLPGARSWSLVPWFSEIYQDQIAEDLDKNKTKLIIFHSGFNVWGHSAASYSERIVQLLNEKYYQIDPNLPMGSIVFLRKPDPSDN